MREKQGFKISGDTSQINLSGSTNDWNGVCLDYAETALTRFELNFNPTPEGLGDCGYSANISRENLQWNGSCLASIDPSKK